jgi:hypothetical protein
MCADWPAAFRSGWSSAGRGLFGGLLFGSMLGGSDGGWIVHDDGGQVGGGDAGPCRVTSQPHEDDPLSGRPPDVGRR